MSMFNTQGVGIAPTVMETVTGKLIDLQNPLPENICIQDIAWSLSRIPRFTGHSISVTPYSVAQHCLFVAGLIAKWHPNNKQLILKGLLHDGAECYTNDISGPMKKIPEIRPYIKKVEHALDTAIYEAFHMSSMTHEEEAIIKEADNYAQRLEGHAFMQSRGLQWTGLPDVSIIELQNFEQPISNVDAYNRFLDKFNWCIT